MTKEKKRALHWFFLYLFLILFNATPLSAAPTTASQAAIIVRNWLMLDYRPMGAEMGGVLRTETYSINGITAYHIVYLQPKGFVVVPADDRIEPIIAFFPQATEYDPSYKNPVGALIHRDVTARIATVIKGNETNRFAVMPSKDYPANSAQRKWRILEGITERNNVASLEMISDICVPPLIKSTWGQGKVNLLWNCYNYFTPNNYPAGCTATAMAQIMRYHQHPFLGVGDSIFSITVDGISESRRLRGGDGNGGPYDWNDMPLKPGITVSDTQRKAIGALTHDAGLSVNMKYTDKSSAALASKGADSFVSVFAYGNAIAGAGFHPDDVPDELPVEDLIIPKILVMVNSNLDAKYPVILSIYGKGPKSHAVVCEGYGFNMGTMYHFLNMGWSGEDNAWYNFPVMETSQGEFDLFFECVYNIYPTGNGEIISGRVTSGTGAPISDVLVRLSGIVMRTTTTDSNGIYAFSKLPSNNNYTITVSKAGHIFTPSSRVVATGQSLTHTKITGNLWMVNFSSIIQRKYYSLLNKWGSFAPGDAQLLNPMDIALDTSGDIRVLCPGSSRVQTFDSSGNFISGWTTGANTPYGISVDGNGNVYIADTYNHRIQKFSASGELIVQWGSQGTEDGQFNNPWSVAADSDGNVYVADGYNSRVQKFSPSGVFLLKWGKYGADDGDFSGSVGSIALNNTGQLIYVIDHRVQIFTPSGAFLSKWEFEGEHPQKISVDNIGNVYITDLWGVHKFSSSGAFITKWPVDGIAVGVAVDSMGNVFVVDADNHCIHEFGPGVPGAWVIGADGNTYRYEDGVWTWTPAKADYLSAVNKNVCWISQTGSSTLYKYDNGSWTWTPAKAKWVAAYGADSLWLVQATSDNLFMYEGGVWTWTPAKVKNISAPSSNVVWLIQRDSENLYKYTVSTNTWEWTPGKAKSISAATENVVWLVADNDYLFRYDHNTNHWKWHNIKAQSVSAVSETEVLFIDLQGRLNRFVDGVFPITTTIGGACKDVGAYPNPALSYAKSMYGKLQSSSIELEKGEASGCLSIRSAPCFLLFSLPLLPLLYALKKQRG